MEVLQYRRGVVWHIDQRFAKESRLGGVGLGREGPDQPQYLNLIGEVIFDSLSIPPLLPIEDPNNPLETVSLQELSMVLILLEHALQFGDEWSD